MQIEDLLKASGGVGGVGVAGGAARRGRRRARASPVAQIEEAGVAQLLKDLIAFLFCF
jgi:hypothetical protein